MFEIRKSIHGQVYRFLKSEHTNWKLLSAFEWESQLIYKWYIYAELQSGKV